MTLLLLLLLLLFSPTSTKQQALNIVLSNGVQSESKVLMKATAFEGC